MGAAAIPIALAISTGAAVHQAEQSRSAQQGQAREAQKQQLATQKKQEDLLRSRPQQIEPSTAQADASRRRRDLRRGFASTLKTSGQTLSSPAISRPQLAAGLKDRLGQ